MGLLQFLLIQTFFSHFHFTTTSYFPSCHLVCRYGSDRIWSGYQLASQKDGAGRRVFLFLLHLGMKTRQWIGTWIATGRDVVCPKEGPSSTARSLGRRCLAHDLPHAGPLILSRGQPCTPLLTHLASGTSSFKPSAMGYVMLFISPDLVHSRSSSSISSVGCSGLVLHIGSRVC